MISKIALMGHRNFLPPDIENRLTMALENEIKSDSYNFIVGTHGDFDRMAFFKGGGVT